MRMMRKERRLWINGRLCCKILHQMKCSRLKFKQKKMRQIELINFEQVYYETIEHETVIRGAYFVDYESKEKIDFQVFYKFLIDRLEARRGNCCLISTIKERGYFI